jgi:hypothetical protein
MGNDDIPEELQSGTDGPSDGFEDAIEEAIQSEDPRLGLLSISATDKMEYLKGNHEQSYNVEFFRPNNGGTKKGMALVDAYKEGGEWAADVIQIGMN